MADEDEPKEKPRSRLYVVKRAELTGYTLKQKFHEVNEMCELKNSNYELRRSADGEMMRLQDQVIRYLRESNQDLQWKVHLEGSGDESLIKAALKNERRLRLELQRGSLLTANDKLFDKFQGAHRVVELIRACRMKRLRKLAERSVELSYLDQLDQDADDSRVEKDRARIENNIAKLKFKLDTAKFLRDKYRLILEKMLEEERQFSVRLGQIRSIFNDNKRELRDLKEIQRETRQTADDKLAELARTERAVAAQRVEREETTARRLHEHSVRRFDFQKQRERRARGESLVAQTDSIAQLEHRVQEAKVALLRYADTFGLVRQKTMSEPHDTMLRILTQSSGFDELRERRSQVAAKKATLQFEIDRLQEMRSGLRFSRSSETSKTQLEIDKVKAEVEELVAQKEENCRKVDMASSVLIEVSRGIQTLFDKLPAVIDVSDVAVGSRKVHPTEDLSNYRKLSLCAERLLRLKTEMDADVGREEAVSSIVCSLCQDAQEMFKNRPPVQPYMLPRIPSTDDIDIITAGVKFLTREQLKKKSDKLLKANQKAPPLVE